MTREVKQVGMAQFAVGRETDILKTLGLGSCVGICLHDQRLRLAGMVHIMLPEMELYQDQQNEAKYADTGVRLLVRELQRLGAMPSRLKAKLAGGAQMFSFAGQSEIMRIGQRNVIASKKALQDLSIPIIGEHTGGNYGRTIQLECDTGVLEVRTIGKGTHRI